MKRLARDGSPHLLRNWKRHGGERGTREGERAAPAWVLDGREWRAQGWRAVIRISGL